MVVADDEVLIREYLRTGIDWAKRNIEVVACCSNGNDALDAVIDNAPDLVLTDIKMPGLSGIELIERLRENDNFVEIIFVSGYADFSYAHQAVKLGVSGYILKPIDEDKLFEAIDKAKKRIDKNRTMDTVIKDFASSVEAEQQNAICLVKKYVTANLSSADITLKKIAGSVVHMNVDYLGRMFIKESGEKFSTYLRRVRMEKAKMLLDNGYTDLYVIAREVGCGEGVRYFSQMFKAYTGMTPVQYIKTDLK
jgi:YesN/AraC family two-component response regulator